MGGPLSACDCRCAGLNLSASTWPALISCKVIRLKPALPHEDFLALWKDTDPDVPILKKAKTEYGKLP